MVKSVVTLITVLDVKLPAVTVPKFAVIADSELTLILLAVTALEDICAAFIVPV